MIIVVHAQISTIIIIVESVVVISIKAEAMIINFGVHYVIEITARRTISDLIILAINEVVQTGDSCSVFLKNSDSHLTFIHKYFIKYGSVSNKIQ